MRNRSVVLCTMLLLVLLAFALRLYRLDHQPLRGDESFTIQFSAHPLSWLVPSIANVEPNPPLYYFLLHYWMEILGQSEFITRFVSLVFGVLAVPVIYRLGNALGRPKVGMLAAFLAAINPFQIWHAQDVRNYTIWPLLSMGGLIFLLYALRTGRKRCWAGYAGMTVLSLYTHYYHLFMLLFENVLVLTVVLTGWQQEGTARLSRRRLLFTWLVIQTVLAVTYVPWLVYGSSRLLFYATHADSPPLWAVFSRSLTAFSLAETVPRELAAISLPFLLALLLIGLGYALRKDRFAALFLILYIVVPSVCVFIATQVRPLFRERYLNVVAPAYCLSLSYGLLAIRNELPRWKVAPVVAGVGLLTLSSAYSLSNHYWNPAYGKSPDWPALTDYLAEETGLGDVIVLNYPDPTFSHYYHGQAPSFILPRGPLSEEIKTETAEALRFLSERHERIWFYPLKDIHWDNEGFVETWLNRHGRLMGERNILGFRWLIYEPFTLSVEDIENPIALALGDAIMLRGSEFQGGQPNGSGMISVESGSSLRLNLYWEAVQNVDASYTVFIHLVDAEDHICAQRDRLPQDGDFPTEEWMAGDIIVDRYSILVPADTPLGEYLLVVGMYDPIDGGRLPVFDESGVPQGDRATIARVRIQ